MEFRGFHGTAKLKATGRVAGCGTAYRNVGKLRISSPWCSNKHRQVESVTPLNKSSYYPVATVLSMSGYERCLFSMLGAA